MYSLYCYHKEKEKLILTLKDNLLNKFKSLSEIHKAEVIDFIEFLKMCKDKKKIN